MHGNSMNVSIKNNLKLLRKRDKFRCFLGGYNNNKKTEYNLPKASGKQLRAIRKQMQQERKLWWFNVVTLTLTAFVLLVVVLIAIIKAI